jgi:hypothetical protein
MATCMAKGCSCAATHIVVSYMHDIVGGGIVYCSQHAFDEGRERCPCCGSYQIDYEDAEADWTKIELLPTYPAGSMDGQGCCSEHP